MLSIKKRFRNYQVELNDKSTQMRSDFLRGYSGGRLESSLIEVFLRLYVERFGRMITPRPGRQLSDRCHLRRLARSWKMDPMKSSLVRAASSEVIPEGS
jgi:hypothetical protein